MNHKKLESGDRRLCSLTTGMKVRVRSGGRNKERTAAGVGMGVSRGGTSQKRIPG